MSERQQDRVPASPAVTAMMQLALGEGKVEEALLGLNKLIEIGRPPDLQEALFRRIQILLLIHDEQALPQANALLKAYPDYPMVPYLHLWIARWAESRQLDDKVLQHALAALRHRFITEAVRVRVATYGAAAARRSPDWQAVQWFLEAAGLAPEKRELWLREAASRASTAMLGRLREAGLLQDEIGRDLILDASRGYLVTGDMAAVRTLDGWLQESFPRSEAARTSRAWAAGTTHPSRIGLMLPLSGQYAAFGRQALSGARLALNALTDRQSIRLVIENTAALPAQSDDEACLRAYQQLLEQQVDLIIGPLLGSCVDTLASRMRGKIPMISLSTHSSLVKKSPLLFVHTLSAAMQARFMADYAFRNHVLRTVVVSTDAPSSQAEAEAFADEFSKLGGEVADILVLPKDSIDFRDDLRGLRMRTDQEELLAELDEDIALSEQAEEEIEIRMPVNFDAAFLALPGRQVALLAGQLAYVGVKGVRLYGSSRWQDGYLLSDKGRYLQRSRFSDVSFPNGPSADLRRFKLAWRDVWGLQRPGKLAGLAYDSMLIAALMTHRMGLSGHSLLAGLKDQAGFPGLTGHVKFSPSGLGIKDFEIYRIRKGEIIPAG
ncbi:MAG: penicillin-binding protein activator [Mariprofundaceae bacterium]|nr:penicillin-binding protein activator [Mariprofundaceae bacterium]